MRLTSLTVENFRCFKSLRIELHPHLTVLIAPNGAGKTTVLDAARIALWPFVKGFDLGSQTGKGAAIAMDDVRLERKPDGNMEPQLPSFVEVEAAWEPTLLSRGGGQGWRQTRERVKPGTGTLGDDSARSVTAKGRSMEQLVRSDHPVTLPLVAHLGTSRLWYEGRFTSVAEDVALNKSDYSRTSGYLNCLSYSSSFKTFTAWYGAMFRSFREEQISALEKGVPLSENGRRFESIVKVVKTAIDALVKGPTGWHSLEYRASEHQQLVMQHDERGSMPVDMLSDGLRNAIAMVADLAFRACKLNPQFGEDAARETPGVALIDEVDMFLHPSWQQTILSSLREAFPKIQFIVTTHSPQVISTVERDSIRVLGVDVEGNAIAAPPLAQTYGLSSQLVLQRVMRVDPQPPIEERSDLRELTRLVDQGHYDRPQAVELMARLTAQLGDTNEQLGRLRRNIARHRALVAMSASSGTSTDDGPGSQ